MAAGSGDGGQPPAKEKVRDVIQYFRAVKRFKPEEPRTYVTSIDFDDTGELAISSRSDDTLQIYNCKEGKHAKELKSQKYGAYLARFTHHSQSILHTSTKVDDQIRYLSTHDNSYIRYFKGHTAPVTCLTMCPSNDEFMSCSEDGTLRLWAINSPNARGVLQLKGGYLAAYDPSASVIAVASGLAHSLLLYDLRNFDKKPFATFDLLEHEARHDPAARGRNWTKLEFSNDGKNIVVATGGAGHFVLDSFEGTLRHFCKRPAPSQRCVPGETVPGKAAGQGDVCFSPDGQFLLGGSGLDDGIAVWDVKQPEGNDGVLRHSVKLPFPAGVADRVEVAVYNPRFNMVCTADRNVMMWLPDTELYTPL